MLDFAKDKENIYVCVRQRNHSNRALNMCSITYKSVSDNLNSDAKMTEHIISQTVICYYAM